VRLRAHDGFIGANRVAFSIAFGVTFAITNTIAPARLPCDSARTEWGCAHVRRKSKTGGDVWRGRIDRSTERHVGQERKLLDPDQSIGESAAPRLCGFCFRSGAQGHRYFRRVTIGAWKIARPSQ
jgi:hypothetical protein